MVNGKYRVSFTVTDTGIGITPENLNSALCEVDSALNRQYEVTGLGLALIKCNVELHGGYVHVSGELALGSSFTISLPALAENLPPNFTPLS
ncbi:MAG: ATP-binding protein, partial [Dolichospermum sp.]